MSKAFDRFLQDHWYWPPSDSKSLIGELAFDNADSGGCQGRNSAAHHYSNLKVLPGSGAVLCCDTELEILDAGFH